MESQSDLSADAAFGSAESSELQHRVLRVAARLFARHGFHAVSVREIAAECDVSVSSVLYGGRTKQQLLEQILARSFTDDSPWPAILTELDPAKCQDRESFLRVYDIFVTELVQHAVAFPDTRRLWLRLLLDQPELFEAFEAKYTRPLARHGFDLLCAARDLGTIQADDAMLRHFLGGIDWMINGFFVGGMFDFDGRRLERTEPKAIQQLVDHLKNHARVWFPART